MQSIIPLLVKAVFYELGPETSENRWRFDLVDLQSSLKTGSSEFRKCLIIYKCFSDLSHIINKLEYLYLLELLSRFTIHYKTCQLSFL
jgi:hypothetical protein